MHRRIMAPEREVFMEDYNKALEATRHYWSDLEIGLCTTSYGSAGNSKP